MYYYYNLIQNKNEICDEERKECMKEYIDTIDSTKKEQQKIEPKTASNKDENQNNEFNKPKSITNIETIEPDFNYINQDYSPQKSQRDKPKIPSKSKVDENIGKDISFNFENFYKLRPHFFLIEQYLEPFNIKIIESDSINLKQAIEKISVGIEKYGEIFQNEKSLSEGVKILEKIIYLSDKKQKIEKIINNKNKIINFVNGDNFINLNFWHNQKDNINNNIINCLNYGEISSNTFNNKKDEKENDNNFLNKKRNLKEDNAELDKGVKTNNNNIKINKNKNPGRLSNEKKNKGEKGVKDGSHPDNALIKIMRHSLENICSIFITIVHLIDANAYIFLPGINDKDLKNTTLKQDYLGKTIKEILCSYISIETKRKKFEENRAIIKDLLEQNIPGKEKEKNLLEKILEMNLKDVCIKYISNVKDFIDGYTFNTFEDDEDFKEIDDAKIAKILEHSNDLIYNKIIKRPKSSQ